MEYRCAPFDVQRPDTFTFTSPLSSPNSSRSRLEACQRLCAATSRTLAMLSRLSLALFTRSPVRSTKVMAHSRLASRKTRTRSASMAASSSCLIGFAAIIVLPVGGAVSVPDHVSGGTAPLEKDGPPHTDRFPHREV